jgi:hypothetical protein
VNKTISYGDIAMDILKFPAGQQVWSSNNLLGDGTGDYYLIIYDNLTDKLRLLSLEEGIILTDEYDNVEELRQLNGDLEPVIRACVYVTE